MTNVHTAAAIIMTGLMVAGCSTTVPIPYSPENAYEMTGGASVRDFDYMPPKPLPPNQIRNTAAGEIFLPVTVGAQVANAVRKELRYAGLATKSGAGCEVGGTVHDFAFDDLGFNVDFITDIEYVISPEKTAAEVYRKRFSVRLRGPKGGPDTLQNINKMLSDNIAKLMADPEFQALFPATCSRQRDGR